jgi:RNA polymerase sigma-70 factor (ECF subfamily)
VTTVDVGQVWRDEWGRVLALLVAQYRRLDLAEDALADAFEAAARVWPEQGAPVNPAAWLLTVARRRVVDRLRAEAVAARRQQLLLVDAEVQQRAHAVLADPGGLVPDERLRLLLLCAHPALSTEGAAALSLRLVLGVSTEDIARLFLTSTPTMAARLTRAKRRLVVAGVSMTVPDEAHLAERVGVVATVAYLVFTAGYAPGSGPDPVRVALAAEGIRLARVALDLLPRRPMLQALLALMLLQHSRRDARVHHDGTSVSLVLLPDQDRRRWHHDEIAEALRLLGEALHNEPADVDARTHELTLQAVIAAEHATAATAAETRWDRIARTYGELEQLTGSAVVRLNRAVAVAEHEGPVAGLILLEGLDERLATSHRLPATRAALLARAGRGSEARAAYDVAIGRCGNEAERRHLQEARDTLGVTDPPRDRDS